ncbi:MAG: hypothetical protein LBU64_10030 [Planctomycetota bacterium]|jgi:CheY-like chemotaxis protein|nr:hypothetical protein [Planctomycetota bacterium]
MAADSGGTPLVWLLDSERGTLAECLDAFADWAEARLIAPDAGRPDWDNPPDAVFFSAEMAGGAGGEGFAELRREAGDVPLLAVARWRSLAQALDFIRAGADDYLPLPLERGEARERLRAVLEKLERRAFRRPDPDQEEDILAGMAAEREASEADEPEIVDGLPVPTLWEELPCGILVFDSAGNLVFSNSLGLSLFGHDSPAALREALESGLASFAAHATNRKPLADNQWPHILARKVRTARSAVLSIEKPDRRRLWLRIDCLPHLSEGEINRLSMTIVNLTGELPDFVPPPIHPDGPKRKNRRRR